MNKLLMLAVAVLLAGCESVVFEDSPMKAGNYCQGAVEFYHTGETYRGYYSVYFPSGEHKNVLPIMVETAEPC